MFKHWTHFRFLVHCICQTTEMPHIATTTFIKDLRPNASSPRMSSERLIYAKNDRELRWMRWCDVVHLSPRRRRQPDTSRTLACRVAAEHKDLAKRAQRLAAEFLRPSFTNGQWSQHSYPAAVKRPALCLLIITCLWSFGPKGTIFECANIRFFFLLFLGGVVCVYALCGVLMDM